MFSTLKKSLKTGAYYSVVGSLVVVISLVSLILEASPSDSESVFPPAFTNEARKVRPRTLSNSSNASSSSSLASSRSSSSNSLSSSSSSSSELCTPTSISAPLPSSLDICTSYNKTTCTSSYKTSTKMYSSIVQQQQTSMSRRTMITRHKVTSFSFSELYYV